MSRQSKRASGRTTRMLEAAIEKARGGNYVFVIGANQAHADNLKYECAKICDAKIFKARIYPASGGEIRFIVSDDPSWSWETQQYAGALPAFGIFVDHFAVESYYGRVFDLWEQFDK